MQTNDIQQCFSTVEFTIGQAAQARSAERDIPRELRDCIQRLDKQAELVREVILLRDEVRIRKMVDDLEQLGERARCICCGGAKLTQQLRFAVLHMHDELCALKHRVH